MAKMIRYFHIRHNKSPKGGATVRVEAADLLEHRAQRYALDERAALLREAEYLRACRLVQVDDLIELCRERHEAPGVVQ